jgi:hypothetical protein
MTIKHVTYTIYYFYVFFALVAINSHVNVLLLGSNKGLLFEKKKKLLSCFQASYETFLLDDFLSQVYYSCLLKHVRVVCPSGCVKREPTQHFSPIV